MALGVSREHHHAEAVARRQGGLDVVGDQLLQRRAEGRGLVYHHQQFARRRRKRRQRLVLAALDSVGIGRHGGAGQAELQQQGAPLHSKSSSSALRAWRAFSSFCNFSAATTSALRLSGKLASRASLAGLSSPSAFNCCSTSAAEPAWGAGAEAEAGAGAGASACALTACA